MVFAKISNMSVTMARAQFAIAITQHQKGTRYDCLFSHFAPYRANYGLAYFLL